MKTTRYLFVILASIGLSAQAFAQEDTAGDATISFILKLWPYITALVLVLLAFLWLQQIRLWTRQKKDKAHRHSRRGNQLTLLALVSVFALIMLIAPRFIKRYENLFTPQTETPMNPEHRTELILMVEGMTCTGCENAIQNRVSELPGVESVVADHMAGQATVVFDKTQTSREAIALIIEDTGYKVLE